MSTVIYAVVGFAVGWFVIHPLSRKLRRLRADRQELERWRAGYHETSRWLAEFPDAADALAYLKAEADGVNSRFIQELRGVMRARREIDMGTKITKSRIHL